MRVGKDDDLNGSVPSSQSGSMSDVMMNEYLLHREVVCNLRTKLYTAEQQRSGMQIVKRKGDARHNSAEVLSTLHPCVASGYAPCPSVSNRKIFASPTRCCVPHLLLSLATLRSLVSPPTCFFLSTERELREFAPAHRVSPLSPFPDTRFGACVVAKRERLLPREESASLCQSRGELTELGKHLLVLGSFVEEIPRTLLFRDCSSSTLSPAPTSLFARVDWVTTWEQPDDVRYIPLIVPRVFAADLADDNVL